ncbi:MAG: hypothetical protein BWY46_00862 [Firmicutes bacterium ADurb.Bin300]|nr:MAG: hypothetical protein BWY46_00862 [Firmicutes bacterium ADurb.Bin300]
MLTGVQGVNGDKAVRAVRCANMDNINAFVLKKVFVVRIEFCVVSAEEIGGFFSFFFDDIAKCHHFRLGDFFKRRHMLTVSYTAATDNTYFQFFAHISASVTNWFFI